MGKILLMIFCFLGWPFLASAETIVLNTGETIQGDILEKTDAYLKVDTGDATAIYFMDEVESIDGIKTVTEEFSSAAPGPGSQAPQDLVVNPAETLMVSQEGISPEVTMATDVINSALIEAMPGKEALDTQEAGPATSVTSAPPARKDELTAVQPQTAQEYFKRGEGFMGQGDFTRGLADFTRAITLDPQLAQAYVSRGFIYYKIKDFDAAWADVGKARNMGLTVDQEFLDALKKLSGRDS